MTRDMETTEKKTLEKSEESTWAGDTYLPAVDIYESESALRIQADVPGVRKEDVEIDLDNDVLTINARVSVGEYEGLSPLFSEYNVGNFYRRFSVGEAVDREKITAELAHGVLTVTLPKKEKVLPKRIEVGAADGS